MSYKPLVFSDWSRAEDYPDFNWAVSIHIDCFNFADTTPYKVFIQMEPPMIRNLEAETIKNKDFYDLILTWSPQILSYCGNAVLFPFGGCWTHEPETDQKRYAMSFLSSSKMMCYGHEVRKIYFDRMPSTFNDESLPVIKYKSPPNLLDKRGMLVPFQYSVIMENARMKNFFTEKLVDCLATKTIPLYWGCLNVEEFFNPEGILQFETFEELISQVGKLTPEYYAQHESVIEENYQKALTYGNLGQRVHATVNDIWLHPEKIGKWRIS